MAIYYFFWSYVLLISINVCYNRSIQAAKVLPENNPPSALFGGFFYLRRKHGK